MTQWIKCSDRLPEISYLESDNQDGPYKCNPVLCFSPERPGVFCVGYLLKKNKKKRKFSWEFYIPSGDISQGCFEEITHWMPLPNPPEDSS